MRIGHLTTVDMSLALLLGTELAVDAEAGHEVFGLSAPGPYVERVESLGVTHVPVKALTRSWDPRRDLTAFRELSRTIRSLDLDVLHTHNPKTGVMGRIAGRLAGVPVVVNTCHGLWAQPQDSFAKRTFVYALEALASGFSDYELFQNAEDMETLRPALRRGCHRVVGNGVDLERFAPDPEGRRRVRAELEVSDHELLVGTIGRRVREKGVRQFTAAASQLAGKATFVWVGPDDETDSSVPLPVTDAVRHVGERADMPAVYSALDVFVLASHREGFSRASMEAAACGVPMILTDIRGCREIGDDGAHLLLVPPQDGESLARTIDRLLNDSGLRARLGAAARERALMEFDQRRVARISLDTYAGVARRKKVDLASPADGRTTVLHVLPTNLRRGAQVYAGQLRDALAEDAEQQHLVVSLFDAGEGTGRADVQLAVPSGVFRRAGFDPRAALALRRLIRSARAQVVVAHGGEPLKYAVAAAGSTPVVYYKVGLSSAQIERSSSTWLYRALARRATRVVGVSQAILDQAHDLLHVPQAKLSLIPNGRDPDTYHPPTREEGRADPPLVLFVGQLEAGKRPRMFLEMVEALRGRGVTFDAAMVGDGPLRTALGDPAKELEVDLMGVRHDVPDLLRRAAVLVMTSEGATEGMPGVLIEAGLSGVPVVSTAAAGARDVVSNGETGFVVDTDRAEDLAAKVEALLADPDLRAHLARDARLRCEAMFSLETTTQLWRSLVSDPVSQRPCQ